MTDRSTLISNIETDIPDNTSGDVSPADVRTNMVDICNSAVFPEDESALLVNVNSLNDLPTPVSNLITLDATKVYHLGSVVDLDGNSLVIPEGGVSIAALNGARSIAGFTCSENNYTMFVSPAGSYSGDLLMKEITLTVSGTGSQIFDLDNDGNNSALDIVEMNFSNCTSLGELANYRQLFMQDIGFINIDNGFTCSGTWSGGMVIADAVVIGFPASATMLAEGTSLSVAGSIRSNINFLDVDSTSVFCDFTESNIQMDSALRLNGFRTTADDAMPNLPASSVKVKYTDCTGLSDTYVGGAWSITSETATVISSANTLVKMAGTTTYEDLQWFSNTTDNAFVYDSDQSIQVEILGSLAFTGGNGDEMGLQIRKWDDSASAYVNIGARFVQTFSGSGDITLFPFFGNTTLDENDRIEIWIENQTDTTNITANLGGYVQVLER